MIKQRKKSSRGSITVECMIILIPFMLAFFLLLNIARFAEAEMLIHHAITQTAKEISAYSYLATKVGIVEDMQNTNKKSADAQKKVTDTFDSLSALSTAIGDGDISGTYTAGKDTYDNIKAIVDDADNIPGNILAFLKSKGEGLIFSYLAGLLAKSSIKKQIGLTGKDADTYLKDLGVVDGLDGLDFTGSKWNTTTSRPGNCEIVVTFKMQSKMFGMFEVGEHEYVLCASTYIW